MKKIAILVSSILLTLGFIASTSAFGGNTGMTSNFWKLTGTVLSPADDGNSLSVGSIAVVGDIIGNLDMDNGIITNIGNAGTDFVAGGRLNIDANTNVGTAVATDGAFHLENTGNTGIGLGVYSNLGATADASLVKIHADNSAFDKNVFEIVDDGTEVGLSIVKTGTPINSYDVPLYIETTHDSANAGLVHLNDNAKGITIVLDKNDIGKAIAIYHDAVNQNFTSGSFDLQATSVVNDAGTYTKTGSIFNITSEVTETSGTITDSAVVLDINQTHADATGNVVDIDNDGTGNALYIHQDGNLGTNTRALFMHLTSDLVNSLRQGQLIYTNVANTGGVLLAINDDNSASTLTAGQEINIDGIPTNGALYIDNNNSGRAFFTDHDDTGTNPSWELDRDGNNASAITGLKINVANAGAGDAYAAIFEAGKVGIGDTTPSTTLEVNGTIASSVDADTIADSGDGNPATATLQPSTSYVSLTCNDAHTCDITMSETGAVDGQIVRITNVSANACDFADTAGVSELAGVFAMGQYDSLELLYATDRWTEISRSGN